MIYGVLGDIHGRDSWKKTIEQNDDIDHWVFLGDYFDSFDISNVRMEKNFKDIVQYKTIHPDNTTLLLGNHDLHYLFLDDHYRGSGFRAEKALDWNYLLKAHIDQFEVMKWVGNTLCSHAGVTRYWLKAFSSKLKLWNIEVTPENLPHWTKDALLKGPRELTDLVAVVGRKRGGIAATGGPLWCDQDELTKDYVDGFNQAVGHTVQKSDSPVEIKLDTATLFFADLGDKPIEPLFLEI